MSAMPPFIRNGPSTQPQITDRACVVHFLCGDSIAQGLNAPTSATQPASGGPNNMYLWSQQSLAFPGTRLDTSSLAGATTVPYTIGYGLANNQGPSVDMGFRLANSLASRTRPVGYSSGGVDHVFATWAVSGAQMNPTPNNTTIGLAPTFDGNTSFLDVHCTDLMAYLESPNNQWAGNVYLGGLFMVSLAGDASTTNVAGAELIYATSCTDFINDFRTVMGMTSSNLPVIFGRAPTIGAGVTTLDNLDDVRSETDDLDGSNGITVVDLDDTEWGEDEVHRTSTGYGQMAELMADALQTAQPMFPKWRT